MELNKNRKIRKRNKNRYAKKKWSGHEYMESVIEGEKSLWQEGSVKQVGFKLGVKE